MDRASIKAILVASALGAMSFVILDWKSAAVASFLIFVGTVTAAESG